MKILQLTAENIKKIVAVDITPHENVVQITGPNGSGKSSVLDSIFWALAGSRGIEPVPVRVGEAKALIRLDLGDIVVTRRFVAESGGTSLVVENADGARYPSPQAMLDALLGSLSFDPLAFAMAEPKKQLDMLRSLVKVDADLDALDAANANDFARRRDLKAETARLAARAAAIDVPHVLPPRVDVSELLDQMTGATETNEAIHAESARRTEEWDRTERLREMAKEKMAEAQRLVEIAESMEKEAVRIEDALSSLPSVGVPVDVQEIRAQIDAAGVLAAQWGKYNERTQLRQYVDEGEEQIAALSAAMESRTQQKVAAISAAVMPVDGLGFGDGMVTFDGTPFEQASSAVKMRVSVAMAMCANPKLRVLLIKDGSLLDEHSLQMIADMAEAEDYQVWLERVDTTGNIGIVMSEGSIVGTESQDITF